MRKYVLLLLLTGASLITFAQPVYSPAERARRDKQWVTDSLHLSQQQAEKFYGISLDYNQKMDSAAQNPKTKKKKQQQLMARKDAKVKALLNDHALYQRYMRREKEIRHAQSIIYKGPHQPM